MCIRDRFRVVCAPYLIGTPRVWQLHFVPFVEQMKYRDHLIVFEGVLFWRELRLLIVEAALLAFDCTSPDNSTDIVSFPLA